jgi:hypothetical protein
MLVLAALLLEIRLGSSSECDAGGANTYHAPECSCLASAIFI